MPRTLENYFCFQYLTHVSLKNLMGKSRSSVVQWLNSLQLMILKLTICCTIKTWNNIWWIGVPSRVLSMRLNLEYWYPSWGKYRGESRQVGDLLFRQYLLHVNICNFQEYLSWPWGRVIRLYLRANLKTNNGKYPT